MEETDRAYIREKKEREQESRNNADKSLIGQKETSERERGGRKRKKEKKC